MEWLKVSQKVPLQSVVTQQSTWGWTTHVLNRPVVLAKHKGRMPQVHLGPRQLWPPCPWDSSLELMLSTTFGKSLNIHLSISSFNKLERQFLPFSPHDIVCGEEIHSFTYIYSIQSRIRYGLYPHRVHIFSTGHRVYYLFKTFCLLLNT